MNTNTSKTIRRAVAVAAIAVTFASGCGTETATAPANISDPVAEQSDGQQCSGSPQYAEWACDGGSGTAAQDTRSLTPRQADAEGWIRGGGGGR